MSDSNINEAGWWPTSYVISAHARLGGNSGAGAVSAIGTSLNAFSPLDFHLNIFQGRRFSLKMIFLWKEQGLTRNAWWN